MTDLMETSNPNTPLKIFVSYTHDSRDHSQRVLELSNDLRAAGFDCDIDQYHSNQDWPAWMERKIAWADNVLIVCTPTYLRRWNNEELPNIGLGAQWESLLARQYLYESPGVNEKFVPVLFRSEYVQSIPKPLSNVTRVDLSRSDGFESLRRRLLRIPPAEKPPIRTSLSPIQLADGFFCDHVKCDHPQADRSGITAEEESLFPNLFRVSFAHEIQKSRLLVKRRTNLREYLGQVWKGVRDACEPPVDYWIDGREVYSFRAFDGPYWQLLIRTGVLKQLPPIKSSVLARSTRFEEKTLFIKLLNRCLDQLCATPEMPFRMAYSKEMKCHLFVAKTGTLEGKIKVKAFKQHGTRTVYEAVADQQNPDSIQHWKHQAFRHNFVRFGGNWYLVLIPFWAFTSDGQTIPSRWQRFSSANMRKPEKNRAVLGHVIFWSSVLCREPDLLRKAEGFTLHRPSALQVAPSIRDSEWMNVAKPEEKLAIESDLKLDLLL